MIKYSLLNHKIPKNKTKKTQIKKKINLVKKHKPNKSNV